jgi:tripartite-type tricarboxylate transporter receptor subunit TctC
LPAHPSFPAKTVAEFIGTAKANPGKVNVATTPKGTAPAMAAELFKASTGVDITLVPYRGDAPAVTDVLGGQVPAAFGGISAWVAQIRSGKLRAIAIASGARLEMLPDIPIIAETVPGYEASGWAGIVAPKSTPPAIIDTLSRAINAALADPTFKARLSELAAIGFASSPAEFAKHIADETEKWGRLIRAANIKPDWLMPRKSAA